MGKRALPYSEGPLPISVDNPARHRLLLEACDSEPELSSFVTLAFFQGYLFRPMCFIEARATEAGA